ncbi:hypothetical protein BKA82DRAFT_4167498, partial [Pisolithus tinctorius]
HLISVAFLATVCYHTLYAEPWILPAFAFLGTDALLRTPDQLMTFVHIQNCNDGCLAGQHGCVPVYVMIDGLYDGSSVDLGQYETVLLVAGGSGTTFTLGLLDDIVFKCIKTGRSKFAWYIRSFGHISWFAEMLTDIADLAAGTSLDIHFSIVTCLCDPEAVPFIPNCDVKLDRPP